MQLDVGSEPHLSTAQAPCLFLSAILSITPTNSLPKQYTYGDMNYFLHFWSSPEYRQTESDAYEPTVQIAQVGSKNQKAPFAN